MANSLSDMIEQFILSVMQEDDKVTLSRNDLAHYFAVAPSQINYVLSTRFSVDKGYVTESKRGGGGFVCLIRLRGDKSDVLPALIKEIEGMRHLSYNKACDILERLEGDAIVTHEESGIIKSALSDRALATPELNESLRGNIMKEILIGILRR